MNRVKTKSNTYILPVLSDEALIIKRNLINVYLSAEDKPELDDHIFLLYKFRADEEFLRFEDEVSWSVYHVETYDPDPQHVMIVFKRPEYWKKDIDLVIAGKFSETSEKYKKNLIKFHELPEFSQVVSVLYKKEAAFIAMEKVINKGLPEEHWTSIPRTQEASSIFNIERETYKEQYKKVDVLSSANNFLDERKS